MLEDCRALHAPSWSTPLLLDTSACSGDSLESKLDKLEFVHSESVEGILTSEGCLILARATTSSLVTCDGRVGGDDDDAIPGDDVLAT